jgi:hypothetical protein
MPGTHPNMTASLLIPHYRLSSADWRLSRIDINGAAEFDRAPT